MKKFFKWILALLSLSIVAICLVAWFIGIRIPGFTLDPKEVDYQYSDNHLTISGEGIYFQKTANGIAYFRAFSPHVSVSVELKNLNDFGSYQAQDNAISIVSISNIHNEVVSNGSLIEVAHNNLERQFNINESIERYLAQADSVEPSSLQANLPFPQREEYVFASTGDSGGAHELYWGIKRAEQLGADFVLHVGDINYQKIDFDVLPDVMKQSPIPTYMAIGNHEYHGHGNIYYPFFLEHIGPLNTTFVLENKRFINFDTAVDTYFYTRGNRGTLIRKVQQLEKDNPTQEMIVLTHHPLTEPLFLSHPDNQGVKTHGYLGEADWLRETMLDLGATAWIAGDVHVAHDFNDKGMPTYLVGEGMGQQDLLAGEKVSRILLSRFRPGEPISHEWKRLNMPDNGYCSDRTKNDLGRVQIDSIAKRVERAIVLCQETDVYRFMEQHP